MGRKVHGIGVNNADYAVTRYERVNGRSNQVWMCPYYNIWKHVLARCGSGVFLKSNPTYEGCYICGDWVYFMTFRSWMMTQDWEGKELDKDILVEGNKIYSPDTCRFVNAKLNTFLTDRNASRGEWPIGVYYNNHKGKFVAQCQNPFTSKNDHLGYFTCPEAAHGAWLKRKHELACQWADLQDDIDIAKALRKRFLPK